jgi:hypothetical protein
MLGNTSTAQSVGAKRAAYGRRQHAPAVLVRRFALLLCLLGLATAGCWVLPDWALTAQAAGALREWFGPRGWLVPLWLVVLAVRLDRWGRRLGPPVVGPRLLGGGALSLAGVLEPSTEPALYLPLATMGSGLLLAGGRWRRLWDLPPALGRLLLVSGRQFWRVLHDGARQFWRVLHDGARQLGRLLLVGGRQLWRVLRLVARILLDPFLLPPIPPSQVPHLSYPPHGSRPQGWTRPGARRVDRQGRQAGMGGKAQVDERAQDSPWREGGRVRAHRDRGGERRRGSRRLRLPRRTRPADGRSPGADRAGGSVA